jgi:Domain of unknown function (DUF1905)
MNGIVVKGVLLTGHKGPAVEVPFDPARRWGAAQVPLQPGRRGYRVDVSLSGAQFQSVIASRMRRFFVLVPWSVARQAGLAVGDHVRLIVRQAEASASPEQPLGAKAATSKTSASAAGHRALAKGGPRGKPRR